jgi:hypothetical protein
MEESLDSNNQVTLKLRNDSSGLKGPVIEITTLDGLMAGEYTLAMTRDGFMARIPPPKQLLKTASGRGNIFNSAAPAAIGHPVGSTIAGYGQGYPQPSQKIGVQEEGFVQAPPPMTMQQQGWPDRFCGETPFGAQPPRPVHPRNIPDSNIERRAPVPPNAFSQKRGNGPPQGQPGFEQNLKSEKTSDGGCCCFGGSSGSDQTRPVNGQAQQGFEKNSKREKGSSGGCCFRSGNDGASHQIQRGDGQLRGQEHEESSGCCCFGSSKGKESSRPPARSAYDKLGESEKERKKREKEMKKREKKQQKKQKKVRSGGPETSGFYGKKQSSGGCCGLSCC